VQFLKNTEGELVKTTMGWVFLNTNRTKWSVAFDIHYVSYVLLGLMLLTLWRRRTESVREKRQAEIIIITTLTTLILGGITDTLLPLLGFEILPLGVLLCTIVMAGIWYAISKYKLMNLTQEIAAEYVLNTMKDPVIIMNNDFIIGEVNKATMDITGLFDHQIIGESASKVINHFQKNNEFVIELLEKGYMNGYELELINSNNEKTPCLCSGVAVENDYGERIGAILVFHDITSRKKNEELIQHAHKQLNLKVLKLRNVFDHVGEGILTLKNDLMIQGEYSLECERIFGGKVYNKSFSELLYPDDIEMQNFTNELLLKIFYCEEDMRELYMPLLPEEMNIGDKSVSISYKMAKDEKIENFIMVIITDITDKKLLEKRMDEERKTLKMVVKAILGRDDFISLIKGYKKFFKQSFRQIPNTQVEGLLRQIHTFKGSFSQYYMLNLVDKLNQLEDQLYKMEEANILEVINGDKLYLWLQEDLDIIESFTGKDFFKEGELFHIENEKLIKIEEKIRTTVNYKEAKTILAMIKDLRYQSLHELLSNYPEYTIKLSERWGKNIKSFEITGDEVFVDRMDYHEVVKSLVHIFRNCVDHGIEAEDIRLEKGKDIFGKISCVIQDCGENFNIIISDDGRGIDVKFMEMKALEKGLITKDELDSMSEEQKKILVFIPHMTTRDSATNLSGRGIGLKAVKASVEEIGGLIEIKNGIEEGTVFTLTLPKKITSEEVDEISAEAFIEAVVMTTKEHLSENVGLSFESEQMISESIIQLNEITVFISIKGTINGIILFSTNENSVISLLKYLILGDIILEKKESYIDDASGEVVNTIIGNALVKYQETNCLFTIGIPLVLRNKGGYLKHTQLQNKIYSLTCNNHKLSVGILLDFDEDEIYESIGGVING
jgi:PAS domain S-box-containing protein